MVNHQLQEITAKSTENMQGHQLSKVNLISSDYLELTTAVVVLCGGPIKYARISI